MAQPELKDGDDGPDDDLEVDFIPDPTPQFYWTKNPDEIRRAFIFDKYAAPDIDGRIMVENMELIFRWMTSGDLPKPKKSHLKVAED